MGDKVESLCLVVILVMIGNVQCNEDIVSINIRIDGLDEDIGQLKWGLLRLEAKAQHQIDSARIHLRSELNQHISDHVREALARILEGESIEEMVRSEVITEVRQLKRENYQIKRQLRHVLMSLKGVRDEGRISKEAQDKFEQNIDEIDICSKWLAETKLLKTNLEQCENIIVQYRQKSDQKDKKITELKQILDMQNQTCQLQTTNTNTVSGSYTTETTTSEVTTTSTSASTALPTSIASSIIPRIERNRIIVAPYSSSRTHQFRQIDIHSNSVTTYRLRGMKDVTSLAYVPKQRKVMIGLYKPGKIISTDLDRDDVMTVIENIDTWGMTIDEERELIFMTTTKPGQTISRMTTEGKDFTVLTDLNSYGSYPRAIAVNSQEQKIYACNEYKVFMVTYDGRVLQTLATGRKMHGVTLDQTGSILYYNDERKLMKMYQNVTEVLTTLSVTPWNLRFYNHTIFFSSYDSFGSIGAVDIHHKIVTRNLRTLIMRDGQMYSMCLVP